LHTPAAHQAFPCGPFCSLAFSSVPAQPTPSISFLFSCSQATAHGVRPPVALRCPSTLCAGHHRLVRAPTSPWSCACARLPLHHAPLLASCSAPRCRYHHPRTTVYPPVRSLPRVRCKYVLAPGPTSLLDHCHCIVPQSTPSARLFSPTISAVESSELAARVP
jgi:hypothetical protein